MELANRVGRSAEKIAWAHSLRVLLNCSTPIPSFRGAELLIGIPEHQVQLEGGGHPSQNRSLGASSCPNWHGVRVGGREGRRSFWVHARGGARDSQGTEREAGLPFVINCFTERRLLFLDQAVGRTDSSLPDLEDGC